MRTSNSIIMTTALFIAFVTTSVAAQALPFIDDFNDGDDAGWVKPEGTRDWAVVNNVYTRGYEPMSSDGHYISYVGNATWSDYTVSVDAKTMSSSTGWAALLFRVQDGGNYYAFQIEPATNYAKFERRTNHSYSIIRETTLFPTSPYTWYRMMVSVKGTAVQCYLNGKLVFSESGLNIPAGGAGLAGWHMSCEFDNFCVEQTGTPPLNPPLQGEINLGMQSYHAQPGDEIQVPIYIANFESYSISSCQFDLNIDTTVILFAGLSKDSGLVPDWLLEYNDDARSVIRIAMGGTQSPIGYGRGELIRCLFKVRADAANGDSSNIAFSNVLIDENAVVSATTTAGKIAISTVSILYGDVSGNGEVTVFDASKILQRVVGVLNLPDEKVPNFTTAVADVSGNGAVTSYDAALVFQYSMGLLSMFPVEQGGGLLKSGASARVAATLTLETGIAPAAGTVIFVVTGRNLAEFLSGEFVVEYAAGQVDLSDCLVTAALPGSSVESLVETADGKLKVALATDDNIDTDGPVSLFNITVPASAVTAGASPQLVSAMVNEGSIETNLPAFGLLASRSSVPASMMQSGAAIAFRVSNSSLVVQNTARESSLEMFDLTGRRIALATVGDRNTVSADISRFPSGTYLVVLRSVYGTTCRKMTIGR